MVETLAAAEVEDPSSPASSSFPLCPPPAEATRPLTRSDREEQEEEFEAEEEEEEALVVCTGKKLNELLHFQAVRAYPIPIISFFCGMFIQRSTGMSRCPMPLELQA